MSESTSLLKPAAPRCGALAGPASPDVEIVVPVFNEEATLDRSISRLHRFLTQSFMYDAVPAASVATVGQSVTSNNVLAVRRAPAPGSAAVAEAPGGPPSGFGGPGGASSGASPQFAAPPPGASSSVGNGLVAYLEAHQGSAKHLVAANGSMTTAPIILKTGKAVVTIGGFNGRSRRRR